jgi:rod shape-determining protein MreC
MALNLQQSNTSFKGRLLLTSLLVVSLVLLIVYVSESDEGFIHKVQNSVSGFVAPLNFVGSVIGAGTESATSTVEDIAASDDTLQGLRDQNAQLRDEISQLEEYRLEAERLYALLSLKDTYDLEGVAARVIGRSSSSYENVITINKGSNDNISAGLSVMGKAGLVGQVISVTPFTSDIRLISDTQSGVAVLIQSNRQEGILRGSLEGLLYLENIDTNASVALGDTIVTSGLGGSFARGLTIGMVIRIDQASDGITRSIVVAPNTQVSPLEDVFIVFTVNGEGALAQSNSDSGQADES